MFLLLWVSDFPFKTHLPLAVLNRPSLPNRIGQLPLIRAPKGNAAEMVARKLEARLRKLVASSRGGSVFSASASGTGDGAFGRPRSSFIL